MKTRIALSALAVLSIAGPALAGGDASAAAPARSCFWIRMVDGFRSADDRTVYVRASGRDIYELKLAAPCPNVDWSRRIGLHTHGGAAVCEGRTPGVEIVVGGLGTHQHCPVAGVRKLTPAQAGALRAEERP